MTDPKTSFINPYHFLSPDRPQQVISRAAARRTLLPHDAGPAAAEGIADQGQTGEHLRHDVFGEGLHNGRIVCRLTTETPSVFGNEHVERDKQQTKGWGSIVDNLLMKDHQQRNVPAAAATSLKGMISQLVEACSGSAMRVQCNTPMSYRSNYRDETRTAIGMIIEVSEKTRDGKTKHRRKLLPLTLPQLMPLQGDGKAAESGGSESILGIYRNEEVLPWIRYLTGTNWRGDQMTLRVRQSLPFYVEGYQRKRKKNGKGYQDHWLRAPQAKPVGLLENDTLSFGRRNKESYWVVSNEPHVSFSTGATFATKERGDTRPSWHLGFQLHGINPERWSECLYFKKSAPLARRLRNSERNVIAAGDASPITREDVDGLFADGQTPTIGILRRLSEPKGKNNEEPSCVATKYHEILIPVNGFFADGVFPWDADAPAAHRQDLLDVEHQVKDFENQANALAELYDDSRPFRLRDTPDTNHRYGKVRLRHGDLVHFRLKPVPLPAGGFAQIPDELPDCAAEVESLAISAIWRENAQDVYTFLRSAEDWEQRPMSASRKTITMAEAMFGFVDASAESGAANDDDDEDRADGSRSPAKSEGLNTLAGRIRFSAALLSPEESQDADPGNYDILQSLLETTGIDNLIEVPCGSPPGGNRKLFPLRILASPKLPCPEMYFEFAAGVDVPSMRTSLREAGGAAESVAAGNARRTHRERPLRACQPSSAARVQMVPARFVSQRAKRAGCWAALSLANVGRRYGSFVDEQADDEETKGAGASSQGGPDVLLSYRFLQPDRRRT